MISDPTIKFEVTIISDELADCYVHTHNVFGQIHIVSRLDAIDSKTVWEFKCVDNLNLDHKLQIIIYAWVYSKSLMDKLYGKKDFILLNIKSGQMLKLKLNHYLIEQIIELIFQDKYGQKIELDDDEFIKLINKN